MKKISTLFWLIICFSQIFQNKLEAQTYKTYWFNGKQKSEIKLEDNIQQGKQQYWFFSGNEEMLVHYDKGVFHGKTKEWYNNGNISVTGNFSHGEMDEKWIYYYKNGNRKRNSFGAGIFTSKRHH